LDPSEDKVDHISGGSPTIIDPIYQPPPQSDSKGDKEVYMEGQGEELLEKTAEEIKKEAKEEIARAVYLAKEAEKGKRHNDLQENYGSSNDESRDGAPLRRHHPKFNSRCSAGQDRL
jgi:hypothetical protein